MLRSLVSYTRSKYSFLFIYLYQHTTARGERLKEATVEARRVIDGYRGEKEKQFQDFVKTVRKRERERHIIDYAFASHRTLILISCTFLHTHKQIDNPQKYGSSGSQTADLDRQTQEDLSKLRWVCVFECTMIPCVCVDY
jgi:hypothetical protein